VTNYSAMVDWGDGTTTAGTITQPGGPGTAYNVNASHTYQSSGPRTLTTTISDAGVTAATAASSLQVYPRQGILGRTNPGGQFWVGVSNGSSGFATSYWGNWPVNGVWANVLTGDFNGDGMTDLAARDLRTGNWWVSLSTGSGFTTSVWTNWNVRVDWTDVQVGDFNGDGKADIVGRIANPAYGGQWWLATSTGSSLTNSFFGAWNPNATWVDVQVGDFTGAGKAALAGRVAQTGQWWLTIPTGTSSTNSLWATWNPNVTWVDVHVADFTGDGKADIAGRVQETGAWWTAVSTGSSFTSSLWAVWNPLVTWVDVKVGDFSGDGKMDIIGRAMQTGAWWAGLSTGSSFTNSLWAVWSPNVTWVDVQVGDFNSDGKADLTAREMETGQWWTSLSIGNSSQAPTVWATWSTAVGWVNVAMGNFG